MPVYADTAETNISTSSVCGSSAMAGVKAKAEYEAASTDITTQSMFISKANTDLCSIYSLNETAIMSPEAIQEVNTYEIDIDPETAKSYKDAMVEYYKSVEDKIKVQELREKYPDAVYDDYGKLVVNDYDTAASLDIRTPSNWTEEDFKLVCCNPEIQSLIPVVVRIEHETGANALYLMAVAISETGWGKHMAGSYNFFNWSTSGVYSFNSIDDFADYSVSKYANKYTVPSTYTGVLGTTPTVITPKVVNRIYAINSDGSINWNWSEHVSSMMAQLSVARQKAIA